LSAEQLQLIHDGMVAAGERGTARLASSVRLPVAGKTGTAQVRKDGHPSTLAWFVGYAPLDQPQLAVAVMVEGVPESEISVAGGATAAPIARAVFEHHLLPPAVSGIQANPSAGLQTAEPGY
jgi:cell division protein FtsI/penicillin-binding protein 2